LDVGVSVGVRDSSTIRVGGGGVAVRVAVNVAGMGVREGVPVSAAFVEVGMDVEGGNVDRQAVRNRTKMKNGCLINMVS
jgi:hypothetical protein